MRRKLKLEVNREKVLLGFILNSTLVLTETKKSRKRKNRKGMIG